MLGLAAERLNETGHKKGVATMRLTNAEIRARARVRVRRARSGALRTELHYALACGVLPDTLRRDVESRDRRTK